jgi:hypothetical protein
MSESETSDLAERVAMLERELASRPPRRHRDWDAYSAVIASFVGLLALLLAGYTAHLQRKQVEAAVWPRLQLGFAGDRKFVGLTPGVGPARVMAVKVQVGGKTVYNWDEVMTAIGHPDAKYAYSHISGRVIPSGDKVDILEATEGEGSKAMFAAFKENDARFAITICYCSVLDQCWITGSGALPGPIDTDTPIDECPIAEKDQFKN